MLQMSWCRQLMIKRSLLWCYLMCQKPLTVLDMIFYYRNYKCEMFLPKVFTGSIATSLAAGKEYASKMLSLMLLH